MFKAPAVWWQVNRCDHGLVFGKWSDRRVSCIVVLNSVTSFASLGQLRGNYQAFSTEFRKGMPLFLLVAVSTFLVQVISGLITDSKSKAVRMCSRPGVGIIYCAITMVCTRSMSEYRGYFP